MSNQTRAPSGVRPVERQITHPRCPSSGGCGPCSCEWDNLAKAGAIGLLADDLGLLNTLAAFLRRHGSRGETTEELGVHRNIVRIHIAQIEALLGTSLDDPPRTRRRVVALHPAASRPMSPAAVPCTWTTGFSGHHPCAVTTP
jgi:PucR-like helix-turn-helix protein